MEKKENIRNLPPNTVSDHIPFFSCEISRESRGFGAAAAAADAAALRQRGAQLPQGVPPARRRPRGTESAITVTR